MTIVRIIIVLLTACAAPGTAEVLESIPILPGTGDAPSFRPIPPPPGAKPGSEWFECEPSVDWSASGKAEFYVDTLREGGEVFKALRMRINKDSADHTGGGLEQAPILTSVGYVYRVHLTHRCLGVLRHRWTLGFTFLHDEEGSSRTSVYVYTKKDWQTFVSAWLAPPSRKGRFFAPIYFSRLPDKEHADFQVRSIRIERAPVTLLSPRNGETIRRPAPVFSWNLARADRLQVSTSSDFPKGEATRAVTRKQLPVAAYRFPDAFTPGTWYCRLGFKTDEGEMKWSKTSRFVVAPRPPGRWVVDLGPDTSPVDPDAVGLKQSEAAYSPKRGYGLVGAQGLSSHTEPDSGYRRFEFSNEPDTWEGENGKKFNRNRNLTLNTPVSRDFIQGKGPCTFRMDVPNGDYRVLILSGHPTTEDYRPRVFEFEARTSVASARFQKTYPKSWFELHPVRAKAVNGKLEVDIVPTGGDDVWVLNGMLILSETAARTKWGKAEWREWYDNVYGGPGDYKDGIDVSYEANIVAAEGKPPPPTRQEKRLGMILYSRGTKHSMHDLYVPKPEERVDRLFELGSPGEPVHLTFSVYALKDLYSFSATPTDLRASDGSSIIPAARVLVRRTYVMPLVSHVEATRDWMGLLMPWEELDLDARRTQQVFLTADIPPNAMPGKYKGLVRLADETGELYALPLEIEVAPINLEPVGQYYTLWANDHWETGKGDSEAIKELLETGRYAAFHSLATHGFTVVSFGGSVDIRWNPETKTLTTNYDKLRKRITDFQKAGGDARFANVDLQWSAMENFLKAWAPDQASRYKGKRIEGSVMKLTSTFREEFPKWIRSVDECIRAEGIDDIAYRIHDEPAHSPIELQFVRDIAILIRKACPKSYTSTNVSKADFLKYYASAEELDGAPVITLWWPYGGVDEEERERLSKKGVRFVGITSAFSRFYDREGIGFMTWRTRQFGAEDWTYNPYYSSANTYSDGPDFGTGRVLPTAPALTLYRWERAQQGVYDIRYLKTLEAAVREGRASGNAEKVKASEAGKALLDRLWGELDPKAMASLGTVDPVTARREIIRAIAAIYPEGN